MKVSYKLLRCMLSLTAGVCAFCVEAKGVKLSQTVKLQAGWNAVYVTVAPDETADEIFGVWPVNSVAVYDPAAFLDTAQYSGSESSEGTTSTGYRMWRRGHPDLSQVQAIPANSVCVCFNTNLLDLAGFGTTLFGRPAAPRTSWHTSSTDEPMNFVGVLSVAGETTTLSGYFDGLDVGNASFYSVVGVDPVQILTTPIKTTAALANGQVVVATASKISDWSGVLNVSPVGGLDFSTNVQVQTFSVRNDGAKARTVRISLGMGVAARLTDVPTVPTGLLLRDTASITNGWTAFSPSTPVERVLAAGEKVTWQLALDRTKLKGAAGEYYGGLLTFDDVDGGSKMRVTLPVEVTSDGGASGEFAWPKGLWLASAELTTVSYLSNTTAGVTAPDVKAGGKVTARLPLYVDASGKMSLLQRFTFGSDSNGVMHVISGEGETKPHAEITNTKRISAALLPIDQPVIGTTNGVFGTFATFDFTVSENSKVNPFRHVYHPSHDGLKWDFATATPSGDDFENYVSTVKPEVFSVINRIIFEWNSTTGTAWTPQETLSGTLSWRITGVRHEGAITAKGKFVMKRISSVTLDE